MKIANASGGRPAYYDRTPLTIANSASNAQIAPHGLTSRWSYTVPSKRKFQIGSFEASAIRSIVATTAAFAAAFLFLTPFGGSGQFVVVTRLYSNVVNDGRALVGGGGWILGAGDVLVGQTQDASTGGGVDYDTDAIGNEFDA